MMLCGVSCQVRIHCDSCRYVGLGPDLAGNVIAIQFHESNPLELALTAKCAPVAFWWLDLGMCSILYLGLSGDFSKEDWQGMLP